MSNDNSYLAKRCNSWGKDNRQYFVGKWGHEMESILGSDQNETRLFNHAIFVREGQHWMIGFEQRCECDDDDREGTTVLRGDFWEIFVP